MNKLAFLLATALLGGCVTSHSTIMADAANEARLGEARLARSAGTDLVVERLAGPGLLQAGLLPHPAFASGGAH
jgi:hypothetical protein